MPQRRRGRGEGSIHERPDGRWCASLDLGIVNGKRKRKYIYAATRKEVVEKLKAAQAAQANGANLAVERITVGQFLDRWLADVVSRRNKARTVDGYKQIVKDHLKPHIGRHQLDKLRPEHVQAMLNTLAAEGRKYNTVRNVRAALPVLLAQLKKRRAAQEQERQAAGEAWQESGLVFTTRQGGPLEPRNLIRHFKQVLKKAGLPEAIRFHDLRHSCATLLIAQGVHPRVVMEILRHSQISTTMNTYAHVLPRLQRDATTKIEELLAPEAPARSTIDGAATADGGAEDEQTVLPEQGEGDVEGMERAGDADDRDGGQPGDATDEGGSTS
jgi:integrase